MRLTRQRWLQVLYRERRWDTLTIKHKIGIVRLRLKPPENCPGCGVFGNHLVVDTRTGNHYDFHPFWLHSISGQYLDDDTDYEFFCPDCYRERYPAKHTRRPAGECFHGQNLKPWSELKRKARVARIRKLLPMPATCAYCDGTKLELASRSASWPEDNLDDYVWVCRSHAVMIERLHPVIEPAIDLDPELFPHWYNNTMGGSFEGHSILNKTCAAGRFL